MELKIIDLVSAEFLSQDGGVPSWKRVLDSVVIVVTLPVVLPVMLIIAMYIKVVSRGPALFRQERIGYYGQPFTIFKFRTMRVNAPTASHEQYFKDLMNSAQPMVKLDSKGDNRVIRGGGFLRAIGLDELPQLINVLRGEMSLVGPRPCTTAEYQNYSPWHSRRLEALPGLTGLWQVSGKNKLSFEQMIRLDIDYAENNSLWLDLKIMLMTFPVLFSQMAEVVARRLSEWRKREVPEPRLDGVSPRHARADSLGHRLFRMRKEKTCKTRLILESSDADIGVRI